MSIRLASTFAALALVSACAEPAGYGAPTKAAAYEQPPDDGLVDPGCRFVSMYIDNDQNPTTVPWYYCICPGPNPQFDPISWYLGNGYWTYPHEVCYSFGTF